MRQALIRHPETPSEVVTGIDVDFSRPRAGVLALRFTVHADAAALRLPPQAPPARAEGLWRTTCFEAFLTAGGTAYYEFNLAPSSQWAAYRFTAYRSGQSDVAPFETPLITAQCDPNLFVLGAELDLSALHDLDANGSWHLALSAVIEDSTGARSYWALAHPPGKPDFHHSDCFVLELPAACPS